MGAKLFYQWDGEAMRPIRSYQAKADELFVIGQVYGLKIDDERSAKSHADYFQVVKEAWQNLPEELMFHFPHPESLRKHALCRAGYCEAETLVCASAAEAQRFYLSMRRRCDLAVVDGNVLTMMWATSQDYAHMGRKAFRESKEKVQQVLSEMIGVDVRTLRANAGMAA